MIYLKWYITLSCTFSINTISSGLLTVSSNKLRNLFYVLCTVKIRRYFGITVIGLLRLISSRCFISGILERVSRHSDSPCFSLLEKYIFLLLYLFALNGIWITYPNLVARQLNRDIDETRQWNHTNMFCRLCDVGCIMMAYGSGNIYSFDLSRIGYSEWYLILRKKRG